MRNVKRFLAYRCGTVERKAAGMERRMRHVRRFLTHRRGAVALESAIATIPLVLCLAGMFEIVQTIFTRDLVQRAAYRVARANALATTTATDAANLKDRIQQAITTEVGDWLDYDLTMTATCPQPQEGQQAAEYCLSATVQVYNSPTDMAKTDANPNGTLSSEDDAALGGGSGDMVVVRLRLQPRSALGQLQLTLFGDDGLRAIAIMRNEERITT